MLEYFNATGCVHVDKSLSISTYKYCPVYLHNKIIGLSNIRSYSKISLYLHTNLDINPVLKSYLLATVQVTDLNSIAASQIT